jgi:Rrf2 family cysteine metabolism transcriptional repressor
MNFSTRGRYGLRALAYLALHATEGPLALRVVAQRQNISESYLEQVFTILRKAGLVRSVRGAQGGYELNRPATAITVGEILRILEGPIVPVRCVDHANPNSPCENEKNCITMPFWEELRDHLNAFLDRTSLQDLLDQAPESMTRQPMYYI